MWKWLLIIFVGFLVFRVVDKVDFGPSVATIADKPPITVISDGKTIRSSTKPLVPSTGKPDTPDTLKPAEVVGASSFPPAVPTPVVIQPSQEQLQEATRPLAVAATAAVEPPRVEVATVPNVEGQDYQLVEGKMDNGVETKYGVVATRPDGSKGVIWDLKLRPLSGAEANVLAGYIKTGLVPGDNWNG